MTEAQRTPWFRCGVDDPVRPGLYEISYWAGDGDAALYMARWTGRRWQAVNFIAPSQAWSDRWRGLTAPQGSSA